jgi:DNA-binding transcriptional ArsR family regulator
MACQGTPFISAWRNGREHVPSEFDVDIAQSTLSHHVKTLRYAGIIDARQDVTCCLLSLRPELAERFPGLADAVLAQEPVNG